MIETVGIDMTQERFRQLLHIFLYQVCKKERDYFKVNQYYDEADNDKKIMDLILNSKGDVVKEIILKESDESYGNTPLHIACSMHSFVFTKYLMKEGSDENIKNLQEKTPEQILEDEVKAYKGHPPTKERDLTIEKLNLTRSLFMRM